MRVSYDQVALSLSVCFLEVFGPKTSPLNRGSIPVPLGLVSYLGAIVMSLKYALNPCLLQGRRSTSQGRAVRFIQPLAVPNCSFPEAENSFCFLFLVYFIANGVQLKRSQLEEIIKMQKQKKVV